ncbi:MAG: Holliday junction resolvase RuvX [Candidatus Hydrogenedentes bacterium]|nr:Holliday junction resolvase RuvX [Candidatus Hydrogenedentota bacterium]
MEGRIIGLDVGEARTGVALTDPLGIIASPFDTIQVKSLRADAEAVKAIAEEQGAVRIVVGVPLNMEGKVGPQAAKVLEFVETLKETIDIEIVTIDERFSTAAAERSLRESGVKGKRRRKLVDKVAAQQILQLYLDREAHRRTRER